MNDKFDKKYEGIHPNALTERESPKKRRKKGGKKKNFIPLGSNSILGDRRSRNPKLSSSETSEFSEDSVWGYNQA